MSLPLEKRIPAIVLAGGSLSHGLEALDLGTTTKALIQIQGKAIIEYMLDAIYKAETISKTAVVGSAKILEYLFEKYDNKMNLLEWVQFVTEGPDLPYNLAAGLGLFDNEHRVLIASGDAPLITGSEIDYFVNKSIESEADITYAIVESSVIERDFPGVHRTYIKLADGTFDGGSFFCVNPKVILSNKEIVKKAFDSRKSSLSLASMILENLNTSDKIRFTLKFLPSVLFSENSFEKYGKRFAASVPELEHIAEVMLGCKAKAIVVPYSGNAMDIDKPKHLAYANQYMEKNLMEGK